MSIVLDLDQLVSPDNLKNIDIQKLALNKDKLGTLTFDAIYPKLEELRDIFADFVMHSYKDVLPDEQAKAVDSLLTQYLERLNWLKAFDPSQSSDVTGEKNNFEQMIIELYNQVFRNIISSLIHLRQRSLQKNPKQRELVAMQAEVTKARKEYQQIIEELQGKISQLETKSDEVSKAKGEIAAKTTGKYFESQVKIHSAEKERWKVDRDKYFKWLMRIIVANIVVYLILFLVGDIGGWRIKTGTVFNIQYGILKLALVSLLSYAVSYASKNYRINAHLESVNKHRKNVAETLNDFISAGAESDERTIMIQQGVNAMFQHLPTGYDNYNDTKSDTGPIYEITQSVPKNILPK
ncbi:MAG: hypothetical protein WCT32_00055 [Patescibacteria group bacterium]|jgi:hypothetical protein